MQNQRSVALSEVWRMMTRGSAPSAGQDPSDQRRPRARAAAESSACTAGSTDAAGGESARVFGSARCPDGDDRQHGRAGGGHGSTDGSQCAILPAPSHGEEASQMNRRAKRRSCSRGPKFPRTTANQPGCFRGRFLGCTLRRQAAVATTNQPPSAASSSLPTCRGWSSPVPHRQHRRKQAQADRRNQGQAQGQDRADRPATADVSAGSGGTTGKRKQRFSCQSQRGVGLFKLSGHEPPADAPSEGTMVGQFLGFAAFAEGRRRPAQRPDGGHQRSRRACPDPGWSEPAVCDGCDPRSATSSWSIWVAIARSKFRVARCWFSMDKSRWRGLVHRFWRAKSGASGLTSKATNTPKNANTTVREVGPIIRLAESNLGLFTEGDLLSLDLAGPNQVGLGCIR